MAHAVGRPTSFSQELADKICAELAMGKSARTVLSGEGMPAMETFWRWIRTNPSFQEQYARAKQESADAMADEILDISDDGSNDWMEKRFGRDAESTWVVNGEAVQRSKLRVEARKFLMAKMKPKVYGEKLDLTTDGKALPRPLFGGLSITADISRATFGLEGSPNRALAPPNPESEHHI